MLLMGVSLNLHFFFSTLTHLIFTISKCSVLLSVTASTACINELYRDTIKVYVLYLNQSHLYAGVDIWRLSQEARSPLFSLRGESLQHLLSAVYARPLTSLRSPAGDTHSAHHSKSASGLCSQPSKWRFILCTCPISMSFAPRASCRLQHGIIKRKDSHCREIFHFDAAETNLRNMHAWR